MKRLFIGIQLPLDIKEALSDLYQPIKNVKWVEENNLHITLQFLGDIDKPTQIEIHESLMDIKSKRMIVHLNGTSHFSNRILFAKVMPFESLNQLYNTIWTKLNRLKLPLEKRKFQPHVTLARMKQINENLFIPFLKKNALYKSKSFEINQFSMISSILSPQGPTYHEEISYKLIK